MPKLEQTVSTPPIYSMAPTDEQIADFIMNPRKMKANAKRNNEQLSITSIIEIDIMYTLVFL